jgi:hypothetical protein
MYTIIVLLMREMFIIHNEVFRELKLCNDIFAELINRQLFCDFNDTAHSPCFATLMICLRPLLDLLSRIRVIRGAWGCT